MVALGVSGCSVADELSADQTATTEPPSASSTARPDASQQPESPSVPPQTLGPDEVVPGCTDADASGDGDAGDVVGEVVAGIDVDGDGEKDVVRYVAGDEGAAPGEACS